MRHSTQRFQNAFLLTATILLACCFLSTSANAQDFGTSSASEPAAAPLGPLNPANWKMPSFKMPEMKLPTMQSILPQKDEKQRIVKKKDNFFSEIGQTASNSWGRTKEAFNPAKLSPAKFFTTSARTPSKTTQTSKPGFFSSLFNPGQSGASNSSSNKSSAVDFLSQDRPQP